MLLVPPAPPQEPYTPYVAEASAEGEAAIERMEVPEGFQVELFAAEPMLANPVVFHVDHKGDFYVNESFRVNAGVTDMRRHMDWLEDELSNLTVDDRVEMYRRHEGEDFAAYGTEHERIRLIRDTDGDGKADEAIVFADGFNDPADGIAAGVLSYEGDVFYTCIPHLWRLADMDGDGVADVREKLSSGYGVHVALLGHDMHGLVIGPDGKLYFSIGDRGFRVEHEGRVLDLPHTGAVLRCNLDGSDLEVFHTGLRNPQELAFDDYGNLFTGDNNSDGGDKARWVQIVEGADTGWRFYYQYVTEPVERGPWNDEKLWHPWHAEQPAYILPPIANLASGPSGLEYYPGTGLPAEYDNHFFLCDFRGDAKYSGIYAFTHSPKGAGFELGEVKKFVWNTLATDCQFGPDGAFYFSDWVHGWEMTGKGRIYRMTPSEPDPRSVEVRERLRDGVELPKLMPLDPLLEHPDRRVRQEAQFALVEERRWNDLHMLARQSRTPANLHGVWGLGMLAQQDTPSGEQSREYLVQLLYDEQVVPEARAQVVRCLGDLRLADAGDDLLLMLKDPSPRVQMYAAIGLGRIGVPEAAGELYGLIERVGDSDPVLRHAAVMGLLGCADTERLERESAHPNRHVRMATLLVMRRKGDPRIQRFLDDPDPLLVREAATAIHDEVMWEALPALANLIEREELSGNALVRRMLNVNLWLGNNVEVARRLARYALRDDQDELHRVEVLANLADWADPLNIDRVLGRWIELEPRDASYVPGVVAELADQGIGSAPDAVVSAWIHCAAKTGAAGGVSLLDDIARDAGRLAATRVKALRALEKLDAPDLRQAVSVALTDGDGRVRAAALDALQRLSPAEALPLLVQVLERGEWPERRMAYRALGTLDHPDATAVLLDEVKKLPTDLIPAEIALDLVLAAEQRGDEELSMWLEVHGAPREADAELAPWIDGLFGGDKSAGRRIFRQKAELSCLRCHQTTEGAPPVGPDLKGVGERLTRLQLLESIVQPNRRISAGYETETFFLNDGEVIEGRILEESDTAVAVVDSNGDVFDIEKADVEERRPGLSAMPNDLGKSLSRIEMRDLIEYLSSL